ncbi:cytochrome c oxidase subunit 3 [Pannonibacter sp. Q-1]
MKAHPMPHPSTAAPLEHEELEGLPGNVLMWIFILGDVAVFALLLGGFGVAKLLNREAFLAGQAQLSGTAALMETFALILSGWLAAIAVERQRLGRSIRPFLAGATGFGSLFLVFKAGEYAQSLEAFSYEESFAQIYYLLTGFHALHVILGLVLLLVSFARSQAQNLPDFVRYWHFTDIVWLLIFPTVYILR